MKLGIIARCDNRGIAYQTYEACRGLNPDKVLCVLMNDKRWPEQPDRFNPWKTTYADSNMTGRPLKEEVVRKFLDGLDTVFAVETVYDWDLITWAGEMGIQVVVQGNPEFFAHHARHGWGWPHPKWVWPTMWMTDHDDLPDGPLLPVPAPQPQVDALAASPQDDTLRVLHVAGHAALGDRNGTRQFAESLQMIGTKVHVTMIGQDNALPDPRLGRHVTIERIPSGVDNRWTMYEGQHVIVLPRRYGGLCLPAIEACAMGVVPMMTDVPENSLWPIAPMQARKGRIQRVPFGTVPTHAVRPNTIAHEIDKINTNRERLEDHQGRALDWAADNDWESWAPIYRDHFT